MRGRMNPATGVQDRDIVAKLGKEKGDKVMASRWEAGLYYLDEDFPDDPMDLWSAFQKNFVYQTSTFTL